MNPYDTYGSPTEERPTSRYRDEEQYDRSETYRRRSPVEDRRRAPPRNRSRSPVAIDRYQPAGRERAPRDEYFDNARQAAPRDRDDRRRAPSPTAANIDRYVPGQDAGKPVVKMNPLPNPLTHDTQAGFSFFADWWRWENQIKEEKERAKHGGRRPSDRVKGDREAREDRDKERAQIQAAYDQYKQDFQVKMARQFVFLHKNEEWFKERYVPEVRDPIRKRLMEFRQGTFEQWEKDLQAGTFDEFTLEGIYKSDHDGAGGVVEKEEGEAVGGGEVLGVLDLLPARGGELRDESISQPALLIKTLAPNVSRERVEEVCKEHLGEGAGGLKWLSLSDPNPAKKCHRIGWIMLHPGEEEESADPMQDVKREDDGDEGEDGEARESRDDDAARANGSTATTPAQRALELIDGKVIADPVRGDFTCHVGIHNAPHAPRKKALWDLFSAPERVERDYELARRLVHKLDAELGKDETNGGLAQIDVRVDQLRSQGLLQPPSKPQKANAFEDNDDEIKFDDAEEGEDEDEEDDEELLVVKKKLDLMVEYLRRVFNFCFFCVFESDSVHELVRKCPGGHLRRPRAGLNSLAKAAAKASALGEPFPSKKKGENSFEDEVTSPVEERRPPKFNNKTDQQLLRAFNWVKTFEDKILQLLEPEYVDVKKLGGKPVDEALDEELAKYVKQEDESKFRCKVPDCTKLFKAEHFWRKHVEKRHEEWYAERKKELELVNTYVLDPSHIAPSRSDANSNGHFPLPNNYHLTSGTPRGFNLQNMNMMNFGQNGMANMNGMPNMQPGFMPGMANPFNMSGDMNGMHNPGAVRRGGGRFNNNRTGPYDRGSRNTRGNMGGMNMRGGFMPGMGNGMGMNMGYVAQGGGGGGGKWGDGAGGGANARGPPEAVQGRSIKSYEDLDAQPAPQGGGGMQGANGGATELDY